MNDPLTSIRLRLDQVRDRLACGDSALGREELRELAELLADLIDSVERRGRLTDRRLKQLEHALATVDLHVGAIENSRFFRFMRWAGRPLLDARVKAGQWLLHSRFHGLYLRLRPPGPGPYSAWLEREPPAPATAPQGVRFSLLLPIYKPRREWLEEAIASVRSQTYSDWELCVCDDASPEPWVAEFLDSLTASEPRIHVSRSAANLGISGALNQAARLATGQYLAGLDQDDRLSPDALATLAAALQDGGTDLAYTDEDRLDERGRRVEPIFKPDWSPDLLLSSMYIGHLMAFSRAAWERSGGFRSEYDGAQDYDLALRLADGPIAVRHIGRVLYHWRRHPGSTAADPNAKPYTHAAGKKALADALLRRSAPAQVEDGPRPNLYRIRWKPQEGPLATLIICSQSPRLLAQCLDAITSKTDYSRRKIVVTQHLGHEDDALQAVIQAHGARAVPYTGAFNFSRMNNLGAWAAAGEVLVFLNDDIEPLDATWLERLIGQVQRPDVGIAGARLLYPSGTLQHAGITIGIGDGCGHAGRGAYLAPYWPWLDVTRDVSAVTGACLAIPRELFLRLDGFAEEFPVNYNDADLCLRVRAAGYRVIYDSAVLLRHHECQTRRGGVAFKERQRWYERWGDELDAGDPFYSLHLTRKGEDLSLRLED